MRTILVVAAVLLVCGCGPLDVDEVADAGPADVAPADPSPGNPCDAHTGSPAACRASGNGQDFAPDAG